MEEAVWQGGGHGNNVKTTLPVVRADHHCHGMAGPPNATRKLGQMAQRSRQQRTTKSSGTNGTTIGTPPKLLLMMMMGHFRKCNNNNNNLIHYHKGLRARGTDLPLGS